MSILENPPPPEPSRGHRKARADLDKRMPVGAKLVGGEGDITLEVEEAPRDAGWDWILEHHPAVSPETHEIDETVPVEVGSWEMGYVKERIANPDRLDGEKIIKIRDESASKTLYRYKAKVRLRKPGERLTRPHLDELVKTVRRRKAIAPPENTGPWLVVSLADWQVGKADFGGTPVLVERLAKTFDDLRAKVRKLKPAGVTLVDLGDICEQVSCFYDSQTYTVDLNLTEQIEVATELFIAAVEAVADLTPRVLVGAVPSNHGEFRVAKGTVVTDRARDNIDLVIANNMARVFAANPDRYGHVEVWTPPKDGGDPYVLTLDMDGIIVGFSHGHQVRAMGKGRMAGLEQWWQNHQWSDRKRPRGDSLPTIADADIVVLGHGHTLLVSEQTGKLLIQAPAAESGSEYFSTSTGNRSSSGTLTFQVSEQWPLLANGFEIL